MRIALVSREVYPYVGGGIAPIVAAAAHALSSVAEVTIVTSAAHRAEHERLKAAGDPRLAPEAVRIVWVEEPGADEVHAHFSYMHAYSAGVDRAIRAAFPDRGPDLIEFPDYLSEGFVTVQARHTNDPYLERTLVCIRLHTTSEICAVLDGHMPAEFDTVAVHDAERYTLRHADRLLWSGGDVLRTYQRFYGESSLAPGERIPDAFLAAGAEGQAADAAPRRPGAQLELLYFGRLERRKGVQNLLRAVMSSGLRDVRLTLLGADTATAPLQGSLRSQLELMAGGDDRIRFVDAVPRGDVDAHIEAADVVVVPSLWECWPNVVREALSHNRPVLATPVGGLTEMVVPGVSGWLTRDTSEAAIADALASLSEDRDAIAELIASGGPRARYAEMTDQDSLIRRYRTLISAGRVAPARSDSGDPLVSVVIPYFRLEQYIGETIESVLAQTHQHTEILVVNDGSLRADDEALYDGTYPGVTVLTQPQSGLGAARNFGIASARGRYVLPLDADDLLESSFVARCVDALERDSRLAYVTSWVRYMAPNGAALEADPGYVPYGNWSRLIERNNVGGTCAALFRRRLFDLGFGYSPDLISYEDWLLYYELHRAGHYGAVIPERLFRYRVRPESMMRTFGEPSTAVLADEIRAHVRENEVEWVATER